MPLELGRWGDVSFLIFFEDEEEAGEDEESKGAGEAGEAGEDGPTPPFVLAEGSEAFLSSKRLWSLAKGLVSLIIVAMWSKVQ